MPKWVMSISNHKTFITLALMKQSLLSMGRFVRAKAEGEVVIIVVTSSTVAAIKLIVVDEPYQVKWVGHQGSGGPVVQNTVSAFHEGGRRGYYAMECDVRVSSDGVYYICHDDVFKSSYLLIHHYGINQWDLILGIN